MTDPELIATYVGLLIIEYSDPNNQPNALATIALISGVAIANQIVSQVGAAFSITTLYGQSLAQGAQLNILAQFVGAQRFLVGYPASSFTYFGFEDTRVVFDPSIGGFGDTRVGVPSDHFLDTRLITGTYTLTDAEMVELILYLAAANNAYLSVSAVDDILFAFFGVYVTVEETADMQITYTQDPADPGTLYGIVQYLGAFPHPAGVEVITSP